MTEKNETIGDMPHAQRIMQKLKVNHEGLNISRVPKRTKDEFLALADAEFCGDYGFTLKFLMDDLISSDTKMLIESISNLEVRVSELENKSSVKKDEPEGVPKRKMVDGSERQRRGKE